MPSKVYKKEDIKGYEIGEDLDDEMGFRLNRIEPAFCCIHIDCFHEHENGKVVVYPDRAVKMVCFRKYGGRDYKMLARGDSWTLCDNTLADVSTGNDVTTEEPEIETENPFATWFGPDYTGELPPKRVQATPIINGKVLTNTDIKTNGTCFNIDPTNKCKPNNYSVGRNTTNDNVVIASTTKGVALQQNNNDELIKMSDKDTLAYFVKHHVSPYPGENITLDTFVLKYNEFRSIYGYHSANAISISMQMGKINPYIKTTLRVREIIDTKLYWTIN